MILQLDLFEFAEFVLLESLIKYVYQIDKDKQSNDSEKKQGYIDL